MKQFFSTIIRYQHRFSTAALIIGFGIDVVTFRSINLLAAEVILAAHLVIVAGAIIILAIPRGEGVFLTRARALAPIAHQYSTGNLLSGFLVLYAASGSLAASWPFLAVVIVAAIGNEVIKLEKHLLPFQTAIFFLNVLLFSALATPIALHAVNVPTFLASVGAGSAAFAAFALTLRLIARPTYKASVSLVRAGALSVLALLIFFYFTNLIPPIPLALKDVGFYHSIERAGTVYVVADELRPWYERYLALDGVILHLAPGESAYFYTAIFAPAELDTDVIHRWERLEAGTWLTVNTIEFPIVGGRHGGYRGYSLEERPQPGRYRVSVETTRGAIIGRAYLTVERVPQPIVTTRVVVR